MPMYILSVVTEYSDERVFSQTYMTLICENCNGCLIVSKLIILNLSVWTGLPLVGLALCRVSITQQQKWYLAALANCIFMRSL